MFGFSVSALDVVYSVANDCIELGIHGAFNRMIKALIESPSSKEEVVISSFIKMSSFENNSHKQMIKKVVDVHLPQLKEDEGELGEREGRNYHHHREQLDKQLADQLRIKVINLTFDDDDYD